MYSLDLTLSDSPVWSNALIFLNKDLPVRIIIDLPSYMNKDNDLYDDNE
jgi:hypothetical protein